MAAVFTLLGFAGPSGAAAPGAPSPAPYAAALSAVAAGDVEHALPLFEKALESAPDDLHVANDYRKAVIAAGAYDRALDFFARLTGAHPRAANAWLNYGYEYVDKIPAAGAITQVILANAAITQFGKSIDVARSWIALYTRGNSYLYWPKIFGRAPLAVADLEGAIALARREAKEGRHLSVHARSWVALGDAYWKTDRPEQARAIWREGLAQFPGGAESAQIGERLALLAGPRDGKSLDDYLAEKLDPNRRVDTSLDALWSER